MNSSTIYGATGPTREHLVVAGVGAEVAKLRRDTEKTTGSGVQVISITDGSAVPELTTSGTSVVLNTSGLSPSVPLPNGADGDEKEVVNGANGQGAGGFIFLVCNNNIGNDAYDLPYGAAVKLRWVTALGGWVATNYCANVNAYWD
jgi:hypothetical protein